MLDSLLRPFSYLSIEHSLKSRVDWIYPAVLTVLTLGLIAYFRTVTAVPLFSDSGLTSKIVGFVQTLPGFFLAALAAIATFNKADIDRTMPAPAPSLDIIVAGKSVQIQLTRRRFLCAMFAFLTAESLIIILLGISAITFAGAIKLLLPSRAHEAFSLLFFGVYAFLVWQMLVASFLGLYYLGERLHQPDPNATP